MKAKEKELRAKLNAFFKELAELGYMAKQDFWCCSTCAWEAMSNEESKKAVFYHKQDNDDIKEFGYVYISWNGNGKLIHKTAEKVGLTVEWNGRKGNRMKLS